ncbi:hypothetical protein [Streptomyces sp. NPDC001380]|uniref:hypothetical protein n=1 Tax=Streptomyces sp. NPDC001380 TaxID=3364566 RepID=UPI00367594EB
MAVGIPSGADSVLTTPQDARAYPHWFDVGGGRETAAALRARLAGSGPAVPAPGQVLVAVTDAVGCGQPTGAELWARGSDLTVRWTGGGAAPRECLAPFRAVAVFRMPASSLPAHPTVQGHRPDPAGPGMGRHPAPGGPGAPAAGQSSSASAQATASSG